MPVAKPTALPRWASLLPWVANRYYGAGQRVVNDGGKIYVVNAVGTSGNAGGPTGVGVAIPDPGSPDGLTWDEVGLNAAAWVSGTAYPLGARVTNAAHVYAVLSPGGGNSTVAPVGTGPLPIPPGADGYTWIFIASATAVNVQPSAGQADVGWVPGQAPPAQIMNWLLNTIYLWVLWLQDITNQALTWVGAQVFNGGLFVGATAVLANKLSAPAYGEVRAIGVAQTAAVSAVTQVLFSENGLSRNTVPDFSTNQITLDPGVYEISLSARIAIGAVAGAGASAMDFRVYLPGLGPSLLIVERFDGGNFVNGDEIMVSRSRIYDVSVSTAATLQVQALGVPGTTFGWGGEITFLAKRLGPHS